MKNMHMNNNYIQNQEAGTLADGCLNDSRFCLYIPNIYFLHYYLWYKE